MVKFYVVWLKSLRDGRRSLMMFGANASGCFDFHEFYSHDIVHWEVRWSEGAM